MTQASPLVGSACGRHQSISPHTSRCTIIIKRYVFKSRIGSLSNNESDGYERKRHLKKEFALPQTLSRLFHASRLILQMLAKFFEFNSRGLYQSSRKEKESCFVVFPSSKKREIRLRNVPKKSCVVLRI